MKPILLVLFFALYLCAGLSLKAQTVALEKKTILDNKVDILLPHEFGLMEEKMLKLKYPTERRPTLVYTNRGGTTNVAFNYTSNKATQSELEAGKTHMVAAFKQAYPTAEWLGQGVKEINGRLVGYLEVVTPAVDQKIYNLLFFTDVDGRILIGTFNCLEKERATWQPAAHQILNSLSLRK